MSVWLEVLDPGVATTVQDLGRFGLQRYGVPVSGALDRDSLRLANALAGAPDGAAVLEIRYLGPSLRACGGAVRAALVGGGAQMRLERSSGEAEIVGPGRSFRIEAGETLRVGPLRGRSSCACLAVSGGVATPMALGSRSTFARSGIGGVDGRALLVGDRVPVGAAAVERGETMLENRDEPEWSGVARVVLGPQADHFTDAAIERFLGTVWRVSSDADRMGMRLTPPPGEEARLEHRDGHDITSDGIVTGAVQVPGSGLPILLLVDRQTSGGYPKIATVASVDWPALGRLRPGDGVRFQAVSAGEGAALLRAAEARLAARIAGIGPWRESGVLDLEALYRENLISGPVLGD